MVLKVLFLRNIDLELKFVLPIICDASLQKMIIFSPKKLVSLIGEFPCYEQTILFAAGWLREQAEELARPTFTRATVLKVTGSNTSEEKARVMKLFSDQHGYVFL